MTDRSVRNSLRKNPLMNTTSLVRIYWHAFKLYAIKKVPYVNYDEKLADSQQKSTHHKKTWAIRELALHNLESQNLKMQQLKT